MTIKASARHVIVIGAGAGGLAAAISLAARGLKVTLLERHATPGGKMRSVSVAGQSMDAGPTVFTMRWVFESLFERAGLKLDDHLNLTQASLLARHSWVGSDTLDLFADLDESCEAITELCGVRDADNYRRFAARTEATFNTLDASFMRAQRPNPIALTFSGGVRGMLDLSRTEPFGTLWKSLSRQFHDPRLRQLFARYATYCGSSPFKAPATLMLIAHVERAGVSLVSGGMYALAQALYKVAEHVSVECRFGSEVSELVTGNNGVSGVTLASGEHLSCDAVVFNGDTEALCKGLLGDAVVKATGSRREPSLSAVTELQYARVSGFDLAHHSVFFGQDYPDEFDAVFKRQDMTADPTVYVCAQDRTGDAAATVESTSGGPSSPGSRERLLSLINAPARALTDAERTHAVSLMHQSLAKHGVCTDQGGESSVVATPNEFAALFPATDGALYGRPTHGWMGSFKRPGARSHVPGLYLCGGSVHPGAGVPMATLSGQLAADLLASDWGVV